MVEKVRDEAIKNRFNVIIEGTFKTSEKPLRELNNLKEHEYTTQVVICTCPKELSWQSTISRAQQMEAEGMHPRYVPKEVHDAATEKLASNAATIFNSGLVSQLEIYSRETKLFDSRINNPNNIEKTINNELNGLNKQYQIEFSYNKDISEKIGQRSYDVIVNGVKADELLKTDKQLSFALEGLAQHKDMREKGISADVLKSGTIQPSIGANEIKVTRPEDRTINAIGSKIEAQARSDLQTKKSKDFSL